ncbi:MAG TPA: 30S ribosomal protein S4 [Bacteroidetes bacterium]|nr:30S ribosomal protein S4 [Bacteroidota bacterium]
MARYTGPTTRMARRFGEPIFGPDRSFEKRKYPPGSHGANKRRQQKSDYSVQLEAKQKAKYTYGLLERQFRNLFEKASRKGGITGHVLLQLLESRLDNVVYRLGFAPTRRAARQLVSHRHIMLNGELNNIPSTLLKPGDIVSIRVKSRDLEIVKNSVGAHPEVKNYGWVELNPEQMAGKFLAYPEVEKIPENINVQLIVELYSK